VVALVAYLPEHPQHLDGGSGADRALVLGLGCVEACCLECVSQPVIVDPHQLIEPLVVIAHIVNVSVDGEIVNGRVDVVAKP
jgi:hypothetical protein